MIAPQRQSRVGFTLIELLVVIAIIAILAAILFPVFARAKAKALQTRCLSNIKNIALAFQIYASDHDEMLPDVLNSTYGWDTWNPGGGIPGTQDFMADLLSKLLPYTKSTQIWYCDTDPWGSQPSADNPAADGVVSYSYCVQWKTVCDEDAGKWVEDPFCPELNEYGDDFIGRNPSKQCLMIDNGLADLPSNDLDDYETAHGDMSNVAFWDGHAKSLPKAGFGDIHPPLIRPSATCP